MRKLIGYWFLAGLILASLSIARAESGTAELVFGVYPLLSPSQTVERYAPLQEHLSQALGTRVLLRSAPDFTRFIQRTRSGEYDIIFTAPHMGRLAEKRDGYKGLAQTSEVTVIALARQDSPVRTLTDMKGRALAVGARLSMTYQILNHALGKQGMAIERDVRYVDSAGFSNVIEAIVRGEADAGATILPLWEAASPEQRASLREIYRADPTPGFLILAHSRLAPQTLKKLEQALFDFRKTEAGNAYFNKTRQGDFRPVDAAAMKRIDPYTSAIQTP